MSLFEGGDFDFNNYADYNNYEETTGGMKDGGGSHNKIHIPVGKIIISVIIFILFILYLIFNHV